MIRTLLVEDEPLVRRGLRLLLEEETDIEIVGEAAQGSEAVEMIRRLMPDLVLLDVQMPEGDGFDVVRRVAEHHLPLVVFVTAHDEFALRAFEVDALDYLLKPVSADRLKAAIQRVRRELALDDRQDSAALVRMIERTNLGPAPAGPLRRIVVKERDRYLLLRDEEIEWIEAAGNYASLHARGGEFLVRTTLADLEARLEPTRFARIHRSTIVNVDRVVEVLPDGNQDFLVRLVGGTALRLSRTFRHRLLPRD